MTDTKQAPTDAELTDEWLRRLGGVWHQVEYGSDSIVFQDGERFMHVYTDHQSVKVWTAGKPETHAATVHWVKTEKDFAWVCKVFAFQIDGVN
jgi:hypothetical protein